MPEKISIVKESGETINSNVVSIFSIPETEKRYMITTENAVDPHGLTVLHVSEIVDGSLQKVATDEEWSSIKTIMRAIISGNVGSFQYLPLIDTINASGQYSRDISVSSTAAKQMIDSYNNGDKSNVMGTDNQASSPVIPVNNVQPVAQQPVIQQPITQQTMGQQPMVQQPVVPVGDMNQNANLNGGMVANVPLQATGVIPQVGNGVPQNSGMMPQNEVIPGVNLPDGGVNANPVNLMGGQVNPAWQQNTMINTGVIPVISDNMMNNTGVNNLNPNMNGSLVGAPVNNVIPQNGGMMAQATGAMDSANTMDSMNSGSVLNPSNGAGAIDNDVDDVNNDVQVFIPPMGNNLNNGNNVDNSNLTGAVSNINVSMENQSVTGAKASFAPDASLDEVVMAAQEMFMEGVKNLVQTIQEKVYREMYAKETELKNREAALAQKEQMLNNQMMSAMSNMGMNSMMTQNSVPSNTMMPNTMMANNGMMNGSMMNNNMSMGNMMMNNGMVQQSMPGTMNSFGANQNMMMNNGQQMGMMNTQQFRPTVVQVTNDIQ